MQQQTLDRRGRGTGMLLNRRPTDCNGNTECELHNLFFRLPANMNLAFQRLFPLWLQQLICCLAGCEWVQRGMSSGTAADETLRHILPHLLAT